MNKPCYYCGVIGGNTFTINRFGTTESYAYNGIDRLNNDIGYILGNVVPCCGACNKAKQCMSEDEFKSFISRVYLYFVHK